MTCSIGARRRPGQVDRKMPVAQEKSERGDLVTENVHIAFRGDGCPKPEISGRVSVG